MTQEQRNKIIFRALFEWKRCEVLYLTKSERRFDNVFFEEIISLIGNPIVYAGVCDKVDLDTELQQNDFTEDEIRLVLSQPIELYI